MLDKKKIKALTCESWSRDFHDLPSLWRARDVKEDVVVAGVHVWSLEGRAF